MNPPLTTRPVFLRPWLIWTAGFIAFPIAGLAGTAAAGRVDSPAAALTAGLIVGAVIGAAQSFTSSGRLHHLRWITATTLGMGLGLLLGATAVDFGTSLADLALMGAVTGLALGSAQALALPTRTRARWTWAAALPALWALGWTVTTVIGYEVDNQVPVYGASGAVVFAALSGALQHALMPTDPRQHQATPAARPDGWHSVSECTERSEGRERNAKGWHSVSECTERSEGRERMRRAGTA